MASIGRTVFNLAIKEDRAGTEVRMFVSWLRGPRFDSGRQSLFFLETLLSKLVQCQRFEENI